jgi:hypothetical protein
MGKTQDERRITVQIDHKSAQRKSLPDLSPLSTFTYVRAGASCAVSTVCGPSFVVG